MFLLGILDLTASILIILNLLTNKNIALIYSVTICEQQQKKNQRIVHGQGASNINYSTVVFIFDVCGVHNQSPLLTMATTSLLNGLSHIGQASLPLYAAVSEQVFIPGRSIFHVNIKSQSL